MIFVEMTYQAFILSLCALCIVHVSGGKDNHKENHRHEKSQSFVHTLAQHKKTESRAQPSSQLKDLVCRDGNRRCKFVCTGDDDQWDDDENNDIPVIPYKCPVNTSVSQANFTQREVVFLGPSVDRQTQPTWEVRRNGTEIAETSDCDPGLVVLNNSLTSSVDFEGTFFVDTGGDDDYFGFVFSYQNNKTFYAVMWKKAAQSYWRDQFLVIAEPGLHIKLVNSTTGPGVPLGHALWHTYGITNQTKTIWYDDKNVPWEGKKSYRWVLNHRPVIGLIRVKIFSGNNLIIDSGNVYDDTLLGGRLGVLDYSQAWVSWSNVTYKCNENVTDEIWQQLPPKKRKILDSVVNARTNE